MYVCDVYYIFEHGSVPPRHVPWATHCYGVRILRRRDKHRFSPTSFYTTEPPTELIVGAAPVRQKWKKSVMNWFRKIVFKNVTFLTFCLFLSSLMQRLIVFSSRCASTIWHAYTLSTAEHISINEGLLRLLWLLSVPFARKF